MGKMTARTVAFIIAVLGTFGWLMIATNMFWSGSDAATIGLDRAAGVFISALYAVTGLPALVLAALDRKPRLALMFALAFPGVLALFFAAVVIAFSF
jgi:hypothetical protein